MKFDIQVDDKTITQSTLLHDDIPGYNLPTLEFVLLPVDDDEDLILKEENPEINAHLENVFVHMIDTQDIAIFKSQENMEYIHLKLKDETPFLYNHIPCVKNKRKSHKKKWIDLNI